MFGRLFGNRFWNKVASSLSLSWTTDNGDGTYTENGTLLTKGPTAFSNWFGYENTNSWTVNGGVDFEYISTLNTTSASNENRFSLSSNQLSETFSYSISHYNTNGRFRIRENGSIAYDKWTGTLGTTFRMLWNGSAMEYYENGVLVYTGSYDSGATTLYSRFLISPTATGNTLKFNKADNM